MKKNRVQQKQPMDGPDATLRPVDPQTNEPLMPMETPGYYHDYKTMSQKAFWDEATRNLLEHRVENPPSIRYFSPEQATFWRAVFDHLLPQHDRTAARRIPIAEPIDLRLYQNKGAGYRYENMPPDREAYQLGEQAINEEAREQYSGDFVFLPLHQQEMVLQAIHDGKPKGARAIWKKMSVKRFWQMLMQDALESYYSHPWSWDEIGFGGPAYPRAYTRLERGEPEPWEVEERRYKWKAPAYSVSDIAEATHHFHTEADQNG